MSQENVQAVKRAIAAVNERDVDRYLACCTADVQLQPAWAAIEGIYEGPDAIRRFFADLGDTSADFRLEIERLELVGPDRVIAFLLARGSGRVSGVHAESDVPSASVYDFLNGKIRRIRIFLDRQEALEAAGLSE
jgi:ketosteroid isomerase-like protein